MIAMKRRLLLLLLVLVLAAGLDWLDRQPAEFLDRLASIRDICRQHGVEIIPDIFSVGYGGSVLAYDRNLAAVIPFVDTEVFRSGKASLRFEGFGRYEHGHARVMQEVAVRPHRCYRLSCQVKTEGLDSSGGFRIQVLTADGRSLAPFDPRVPSTADWRRVVMGFNSLDYEIVRVYAGA